MNDRGLVVAEQRSSPSENAIMQQTDFSKLGSNDPLSDLEDEHLASPVLAPLAPEPPVAPQAGPTTALPNADSLADDVLPAASEGLEIPAASTGSALTSKFQSALRTTTSNMASLFKPKSSAGGVQPVEPEPPSVAVVRSPNSETDVNPLIKLKATANTIGAKAKQQSAKLIQASVNTANATAEKLRKWTAPQPLQALCRNEVVEAPCPQLVLACCNALIAGGLQTEGIFKHEAPQEQVDNIFAGEKLQLIPAGTSPHAVAALLKQFLNSLAEPLLTYRLLPEWLAAESCLERVELLVQDLPAANLNALRVIMYTAHAISEAAVTTEMDALALAESLAPVLLWRPPTRAQPVSGPSWGSLLAFGRPAPAPQEQGDAAAPHADAGVESTSAVVPQDAGVAPEQVTDGSDAAAPATADVADVEPASQQPSFTTATVADQVSVVKVVEHMITHAPLLFT